MTLIVEILFWLCVAALFHSYVLFPLLLQMLGRKSNKDFSGLHQSSVKKVSVLISAYNEEEVIEDKINSILKSTYPMDQIEILVGSDHSDDNTDTIVAKLEASHPHVIRFFPSQERRGKPNTINDLATRALGEILILTDANVIFNVNTIYELLVPFGDPHIGLVDSQMVNRGMKVHGISYQEKAYISREVNIKHYESQLWGTMMGPFGGCFAIRSSLFQPIPSTFLVDDFYLNMLVLEKGFKAINNPKAIVYEDVSNDLRIEFRRKIRIATGNFQNLGRFRSMLWPIWSGKAFSFLSHKVIRWYGPHLMILALITLLLISFSSLMYNILLIAYLAILLSPLFDQILRKLNIHISFLRFITHFCAMNLAMLVGYGRYLKGVNSNVWQPTKRNQ